MSRKAPALEELARRARIWRPVDDLFPQQRAFILDTARRKTALCSRRAGKTKSNVLGACQLCLSKPGAQILYLALTKELARDYFWNPFGTSIQEHGLAGSIKTNETLMEARWENGSYIKCRGADDKKEIDKIRGHPQGWDLIIADECASFGPYFDEMVEEVIEPGLLDRRGQLVLTGTPSAKLHGLFYEATTGEMKGWSNHHWTVLDNPFIPHAAEEIKAIIARKGWTEQTAKYQREYLGKWARDDGDLIYNYMESRNDYEALPKEINDFTNILAVDVGYRDRTAFVVGCYSSRSPNLWYVHAEAESELIPAKIAERIKRLQKQYQPAHIVMDCGALGLMIAEEFRQRYGLPIEAAEKREKMAAIELLNGDLVAGRVFAHRNSPLVSEWGTLQYDEDGKEDPRCKNDLCDAATYLYRRALHYLHRPGKPKKSDAQVMDEYEDRLANRTRTLRMRAEAEDEVDREWKANGDDTTEGLVVESEEDRFWSEVSSQ